MPTTPAGPSRDPLLQGRVRRALSPTPLELVCPRRAGDRLGARPSRLLFDLPARSIASTGRRVVAAALVAVVIVVACGGAGPSVGGSAAPSPSGSGPPSRNGASPGPALAGRTFLSTRVLVDDQERPLVPGTRIRITFEDGRLSASAGCNLLGAEYRLEDGVLRIANAAVTEMGCDPPRHAQDDWLFGLLGRGPSVSFDGDELTLKADTTVIGFVDRRIAEPDLPLVGTEWRLATILSGDVASSVPAGVVAGLRFDAAGQLSVETGCNSGGGPYEIDGDELRVGDLLLTKRACLGAAGAVEAAVLAVLEADRVVFGIEGSTLRLVAGPMALDFSAAGLD